MARILVFKIRPSQEILKIRDVARILVFKIRPSQEILKIRDGTPLEKKRVARILVFKIRPSQKILKIRDGTPLEAEEILTYKKSLRNGSVWHFSSKLHVPSNVLQKKRVARILVFKIRPSQEILKIRDGTPLEAEEISTYKKKPSKWIVARILVFKIRPSQEILKIRDGTPLEEWHGFWVSKLGHLKKFSKFMMVPLWRRKKFRHTKKSPRNGSVWHFSSKLDVPSNVLQKKRVARILVFKIRPSQEILKIRDGTPLEAEEILTYRKKPSKWIVKKRVARILVFKIRPSQKILKIRDGTPLEAEEILTYKKSLRNGSVWHFSSKLHVPSNVLQKKRVARILVFKIRPSQEILKIRDGTPLEAEEISTYKKKPSKWIVARILVFKIRPSQEILKIRDGTPLEKKRVARILVFKIRPSQEILKIRDGREWHGFWVSKLGHLKKFSKFMMVPLWRRKKFRHTKKSPRNGSVWHFSSKLDVPSNVLQKKRVARILVFKIRPSQEILKIRDGTPLEKWHGFWFSKLGHLKKFSKFMMVPLWRRKKFRHTKKSPRNGSVWHFSSKLDVPSNVLQKKRVARILVFKIRPSQEILKIRDGTPLEKKKVARILVFKIRPSQKILKIRDGTPLEAEEILTYKKSLRNGSVWHFSSKLHVPSNVLQKKRVARILVFKIRPSQEILKIRDVARILVFKIRPSQEILKIRKKRVAWILVFKIRPSQEILKIRVGTPLEAEEILKYRKSPRKGSVWHFSSKLDVPSNVLQKKRVARIL
ncbi:hypothetical protein OROGR_023064 [Orobanche gracilis]